jgi:HEAT repeat protein
MAHATVRARAHVFVDLLDDADPGVRLEAAKAVAAFGDDGPGVVRLLCERITGERDGNVAVALAESLRIVAQRHPQVADAVTSELVSLLAPAHGPELRLAALSSLARCAPDQLPNDTVELALGLLRSRNPESQTEAENRPPTDTLISHLRRLRMPDQQGLELMRELHNALDDRLGPRTALLEAQLNARNPDERRHALRLLPAFFREWRGSFPQLVVTVGEFLAAGNEQVVSEAVSVLEPLFAMAAPAADRLAALVDDEPETWVKVWDSGPPTLGSALSALIRAGDERAVPILEQVLRQERLPHYLGGEVACLGAAARPLIPMVRNRLATLDLTSEHGLGDAASLFSVLAQFPDPAAAPALRRLLNDLPTEGRERDQVGKTCLRALAACGPDAAGSITNLTELHVSQWPVAAAETMWALHQDVDAVMPTLLRALHSERPGERRQAAGALARLGADATPALPALRALAAQGSSWEQLDAITAVWRVSGDAGPFLAPLRELWISNAYTRTAIAECLGEMRSAAAEFGLDLLRTEVSDPRRSVFRSGGWGSHDIKSDDVLLRSCHAALSAFGSGPA